MYLNDDIIELKKTDGICSPTFVIDVLPKLFLHSSNFSIKHSRSE